jgi:hypothetical protein
MDHPSTETLSRFLWGRASREENRMVVRHLLTLCPDCAAALRAMKPEPVDPAAHDAALARFEERVRALARGADGAGHRAASRISEAVTRKWVFG